MSQHTHLPLLLLLLCLLCGSARAQQPTLKQLYQQIDDAIDHSPEYVATYEQRINDVHSRFDKERDAAKRLDLSKLLFELYRAFNSDSALHYIQVYIDTAQALGRQQEADQGRAIMAYQCSTVGLYTEALGILHDISAATLTPEGQVDYYRSCMHVCGELGFYTSVPAMHDYYQRLKVEYRDSLYSVASPQSEPYLEQREQQLLWQHMFDEALQTNDQRLSNVAPDSRGFAIVSYYRSLIYRTQGEQQKAARWLAMSALADIKNAVMDQASLINLAAQLNSEGDFDRSYRYIRFTWECNNRFNTRMRSWQISPILTVIENNYQNEALRTNRIMLLAVVAVSLLALMLLAALWFLHRRNKQLDSAHAELTRANGQLTDSNARLETQAQELSSLNRQLSAVNGQLTEANHVKEEYIGRFMSLCSQYINKLDDYRKMVNRKMKNKELDELFRLTKSTELKEKELDELYENFDSVFLHLFPTFIDEFNQLLQPEYRIHPKQEYQLTTDLRIFALIRLGIEDSSKIAEFLHYSVNTIYNYRARIKSGAVCNREHFEQRMKEIGLPKA